MQRSHATERPVGLRQVLRVAVLNGPRQAGKTTLAKQLVAATGGSFVTLDDPATLQACLSDPRTFLTAYRKPLVVDEFQLGGDVLLRSVKSIVDEDPSRGQYLLTGSTRFLTVPSISESLAGRAISPGSVPEASLRSSSCGRQRSVGAGSTPTSVR